MVWDNERGVTLIELIIVLSVIVILAITATFEYRGWIGRYRVEGEVRKMYSDLMNARTNSIAHSRVHFINLPAADNTTYAIYEDTDGGVAKILDGDKQLNTAKDERRYGNETGYPLQSAQRQYMIDPKGMIAEGDEPLKTGRSIVFVNADAVDPDYNCIELTATRVNMGFWNGTACESR